MKPCKRDGEKRKEDKKACERKMYETGVSIRVNISSRLIKREEPCTYAQGEVISVGWRHEWIAEMRLMKKMT